MKKTIYLFLIIVIAGLSAWILMKLFSGEKEIQKGVKEEKMAIATVMPKRMDIADIRQFTGTLKADSSFDLASKVDGKLQVITVSLGNKIEPGQLIAKIDDTEYVQALSQAKANLEMGKAQYIEATIAKGLAEREFNRNKTLYESKVFSDAQFELAQATLSSKNAIVDMRKAECEKFEAVYANAKTKLSDTEIKGEWSKGSRYVAKRYVDAGALLSINQPILNIIDISSLKAEINVIERDYTKLKLNHAAKLITDAYPGRVFNGVVVNIAQNLSETARQAAVRLRIPNPENELKPGMFVRVEIEFARHENALVLPKETLVKRDNQLGVFVYLQGSGRVRFRPVTIGLESGNYVEITSPDEINNPVVTVGNHQLMDGTLAIDPSELKKIEE